MGRLAGFAGAGSGSGDGSRAGALRFREDSGRDEAATGPTEADEPDVGSEEMAACLALDLVILVDMNV